MSQEDNPVSGDGLGGAPQPMYRMMRESGPVMDMEGPYGPMSIVWGRREIEEAFRHPEIFASTEAVDLQNIRPLIPLSIDPPDHKKYRKILDPLFAPRAMARLEEPVSALANRLMDAFEGQTEIDFAASFSVPLPSQVFLTLLGLPLEDLPVFLAMKDGIIRPHLVVGTETGHPDSVAHQKKTAMSIYEYFDSVLDARQSDPRDDLVTGFLNTEIDGEKLTREEILDISFLFLIAGLDTVTASLDCMFAFLAGSPDHRRQIVENPAVIPAVVEELLRWETPVVGVPRMTTTDTELGGCPIQAGRVVTLLLGSANTDDVEFGDGDAVRFDRDPNRHLAFGGGIHRCLGSHLARQELRVALREWHKRYPEYSIKPGVELDYTPGIRSIDHFPMILGVIDTAAELVLARTGDDAVGLSFEGRDWTWAEVVAEALSRAAWLAALPGDGPRHMGVMLENTPEYVFLLAGAALAGVTVVGLNPTRRGEELARDIRHTDCQILVTEPAGGRLLEGLDLGATTGRVIDSSSATYLQDVGNHRGKPVPQNLPAPRDIFVLIFTSGSTGHPKAVKVSHGRAARSAAAVPFGRDDVLYSAMPLFHGNALFSSVLPAFLAGCRIVLRRRFSASGFVEDVRASGCTFFNTVGRAIAHINATPPSGGDRDHRLKWVLGPETSEADKAAFTSRFGPPVFDGYGSSENAVILHPAPRSVGRPGSLGVAPPGADIAVVDPSTGEECPPAEFDDEGVLLNAEAAIGELVGRNALERFEGYYNDPEAEAERCRGGWYWSGDLAYRDADGVFYFAGRGGDWMRVDSENFTAAPIERILARAPGIAGVAVYPVPDARTADQVMAAVEVAGGPAAFDPAAFSAWMAAQPDLSPKWVPTYVRVVESLPVTGTDKLDRKPLRAERWRTSDPLWRRAPRTMEFGPMGPDDVADLERQFVANGRANLLS